MNLLAHLWLADCAGADLAGAILGDLVRGADLSAFTETQALSIRLHRRIDAVTDAHDAIRELRAGFAAEGRRYAPVVLDLLCDYGLALRWDELAPAGRAGGAEPLAVFCRRAAAQVAAAAPTFRLLGAPPPAAERFAALLLSYREPGGIDAALRHVAGRARRPALVDAAARRWGMHMQGLHAVLPGLLADLRGMARDFMAAGQDGGSVWGVRPTS